MRTRFLMVEARIKAANNNSDVHLQRTGGHEQKTTEQ